jgi:hypothetical protein
VPSDVGRALSLQQQYALEVIAERCGEIAAAMLREYARSATPEQVDDFAEQYEALILGAMLAAAATRVGYLADFAAAEGQAAPVVAARVLAPTAIDVLVDGINPRGAVYASMRQVALHLERKATDAEAITAGAVLVQEYAESTVTSTGDFVDREVLGPNRTIAALRRVAHPTACDRCQRVAGALVFKHHPALRHPQCRCSFEPVYLTDPDYQVRLAKYRANAEANIPGPYFRDLRYRGRQQLEADRFRRESVWLQDEWTAFLQDEQVRIAGLVKTIPSNTYRDWAVMTSATQAEVGNGLLPVLTRD